MSPGGITDPKYFFTSSGCSCTASPNDENMTPTFSKSFLNVVATDTLSNTASTATPASAACSFVGMPNFSKVAITSGSTSSIDLSFGLGAE